MTRGEVLRLCRARYETEPDYPWSDGNAVLRHPRGRKWYALVMTVPRTRLGLAGAGDADILNVKCDPALVGALRGERGILPAYHMNKEHWLSVVLEAADAERIAYLIDSSFHLTE